MRRLGMIAALGAALLFAPGVVHGEETSSDNGASQAETRIPETIRHRDRAVNAGREEAQEIVAKTAREAANEAAREEASAAARRAIP